VRVLNFNSLYKHLVQIYKEDNTAGAGGVFGDAGSMDHGGAVGNEDFYAPGDARNVLKNNLGTTSRKGKVRTKQDKKKKKKSKVK